MSTAHRGSPGLPSGFGDRLREERERLGLTQGVLAERAGIAIKTLYNYETGASPIAVDFLDGFARLGGDVEYLVFARRRASPREAEIDAVRRAIQFAAEFCRDPKGRPLPLGDEVADYIVRAYEQIAPPAPRVESEVSSAATERRKRA